MLFHHKSYHKLHTGRVSSNLGHYGNLWLNSVEWIKGCCYFKLFLVQMMFMFYANSAQMYAQDIISR